MDIRPPKRRPPVQEPVRTDPPSLTDRAPAIEAPEISEVPKVASTFSIGSKKTSDMSSTRRRLSGPWRIVFILVAVLVLAVGATIGWYKWAVSPVGGSDARQTFVVESGQTPSRIAKNLEQARLIRSAFAFEFYAKVHGSADNLQAGTYKLSPSQSVSSILSELVKGQNAVYNVLIPPGLTLKQLADPSVKGSFASQGFSTEEIAQAFSATYSSELLKDKPASASLEGYIFPETFQVKEGDSLQSVLERSFDTLYARLQADNMLEKFTAKGLTLYQALTLGSIIQKETSSADVQKQVAQVFLKRLELGMMLGSDVTFIYAANQLGVTATPTLDSPYNTRIHTGLPPGPIATMNYSALEAIADPAEGDHLFFVAGDDGVVHFSRTNEEHEQQVQQYCQKLCSSTVQ